MICLVGNRLGMGQTHLYASVGYFPAARGLSPSTSFTYWGQTLNREDD